METHSLISYGTTYPILNAETKQIEIHYKRTSQNGQVFEGNFKNLGFAMAAYYRWEKLQYSKKI